jgi:hypothetical protein
MEPRFRWRCSCRGLVWYSVTDHTGTYEVELRRGVLDYERRDYNGTAEEFARDVVASVGLLRRAYRSDLPIPAETVAAFNAWRAAEHAAQITQLDRSPERYGVIAPTDPIRTPPMVAVGARYEVGTGWIRT